MSSNINKIIYINLDKRPDRKNEIENELNKYNLNYERYSAIEHPNGAIGCSYSHLNVLKIAKENNYKNILILEDDFTFLVTKEEFEFELSRFFNTFQNNYDVCMLSYNVNYEIPLFNCNFVNKILNAQTASGYIVNNHYYDKLINLYEKSIPFLEQTGIDLYYTNDQIWKTLQPLDNWYKLNTRIGKQRSNYSNILNYYVDYGV